MVGCVDVDVPATFINEDKMLFLLFDVELEGSFKGTVSIWRSEGVLMVQLMFIRTRGCTAFSSSPG